MLTEKLFEKLNSQINYEFYSSHIYLAMGAYCANLDLNGCANFFIVQAEEEKFHAMKFFNYVNQMEGRVQLSSIPTPINDYDSILAVFKIALEHEKSVTKRIYDLTDVATEEREHATISFLKWFVDEQVEEESNLIAIIKKLERIGNDATSLYMLDAELATRVFTPPVTTA